MSITVPAHTAMPAGESDIAPASAAQGPSLAARLIDSLLALVAACLETAMVYAAYRHHLSLGWILLGHVFIVGALALWILWCMRSGRDIAAGLLTLIATAATGPFGAFGSAIAALGLKRRQESSELLDEWYERISHSTEVDDDTKQCDLVSTGRAIDLAGPLPCSFSTIMERGTLTQKQNALGLIARKFHPAYLPALQDALKSDQPVIRVQAAAVAAHLRADIKAHMHELIATAGSRRHDPKAALTLAGRIEHFLASNLLEEKDRAEGRVAADRLYDRSIGALELKLPGGAAGSFDEQREREQTANAYESLLLRRGRYADFRALRNSRRRPKEIGG